MYEELLLIERRIPEAGTLWDLGAVRAPQHGAITTATAALPAPQNPVRQPNLQSLLSTNELSFELRKILISLIEAGARLAAAGRNYELTLAQLTAALEEPRKPQPIIVQVITPEEIAARLNSADVNSISTGTSNGGDELYKRAQHLQRFLEKFRAWRIKIMDPPNPEAITALKDLGFSYDDADNALRTTGCNVPAAASWLMGERGSSVFELINGLPDGLILQTLLKQPQIQRGLLNTRMLIAFIAMVGQTGSASLWLNSPHGSPLLSQISRTYHSEKYCLAVNQFSERQEQQTAPKVPHLFWSGGDVIYDAGVGCYAQRGRSRPIGAENYHFPHSMPGLLSMRMTGDDEMCGIFNITFKALPQFDLRNVVFGRVIRPCPTFDVIQTLPANPHPAIEIASARFRLESGWVCGARNARIRPTHPTHVPRPRRQQ
nr:ubiquitin-associated domain-containing protein 1-like isoform X2 [Danaus plexippus plexippus]